MWVFFWSMQLAMWTNGMAYAVSEFARAFLTQFFVILHLHNQSRSSDSRIASLARPAATLPYRQYHAAYSQVAAISGDHWFNTTTKSGMLLDPTPREWTVWSSLSFLFVPVICGPACFVAFGLMLVGVLAGDGRSLEEDKKGH